MAMRARKSGCGAVSLMISLFPLTFTPLTCLSDFGSLLFVGSDPMTASAPTMSDRNGCAGDCMSGLASRSMTKRNVFAVTGWLLGGENLYLPGGTVNV